MEDLTSDLEVGEVYEPYAHGCGSSSTKRMRANLDMTHGLVVSEAVMMGLAPCIGREYAHDLVYDICRVAIHDERLLLDLLA